MYCLKSSLCFVSAEVTQYNLTSFKDLSDNNAITFALFSLEFFRCVIFSSTVINEQLDLNHCNPVPVVLIINSIMVNIKQCVLW